MVKQEIKQIRKEMDILDRTIIISLDKRLDLVKTIGEIKKKNNLPIFDSLREQIILDNTNKDRNNVSIRKIFSIILEQSKKQQENRTIITTLGPEGTCSENAAKTFILNKGVKAEILLKESFEDCIASLKNKNADIVIVPSAFKELNELIFRNLGKIEITESFVLNTPALVFAKKDSKTIKKIATHPSPLILLEKVAPKSKIILTNSNSISALKVAGEEADACITTEIAAKNNNLSIIKNFGKVPMTWNVFRRIK